MDENILDYGGLGVYTSKIKNFVEGKIGDFVPSTRKVNGKALSSDITLTASDINAQPSGSYVPTSRTVNGKALSSNITLTASDVGATGKSMTGQSVKPTSADDIPITVGIGAEIFNDYETRVWAGDTASRGNVAAGEYSHAEGYITTASGLYSHAEGWNTKAYGISSHAEGSYTTATGEYSHAEGGGIASGVCSHAEGSSTASGGYSHSEGGSNTASGAYSHAEGANTIASSDSAHAEGQGTKAEEIYSHAEGRNTTANAQSSHAEGQSTTASATASHAEGYLSKASATASHAEGQGTTASNYASHASGKYNKAMTTGAASNSQIGDVFVVGNGIGDATSYRSNALRLDYSGQLYLTKTYSSSGADYAEYFEWLDGNPNNEDRIGRFVTLDGNKIKLAQEGDYILGIVSGQPCVLGNADEDWLGRWEHDDFGRFVKEYLVDQEVEVNPPANLSDSEIQDWMFENRVEKRDGKYFKIESQIVDYPTNVWRHKPNPNYNPDFAYIERKDRREWDAVGMMGVLAVLDDGTCEVNHYAKVSSNGIATAITEGISGGYRVIERVAPNIVKIVFSIK